MGQVLDFLVGRGPVDFSTGPRDPNAIFGGSEVRGEMPFAAAGDGFEIISATRVPPRRKWPEARGQSPTLDGNQYTIHHKSDSKAI